MISTKDNSSLHRSFGIIKTSLMSPSSLHRWQRIRRVCEKIFRAVTSPIRTVRHISTKPSPNHHHQAEAVRVKFSETAKPITTLEPKKTLITRVETTLKTDERFTDYINKAKLKIRANDDVSDASETETRHHHHVPISRVSRESGSGRSSDRFSEYINKAKMKLRSSSTVTFRH